MFLARQLGELPQCIAALVDTLSPQCVNIVRTTDKSSTGSGACSDVNSVDGLDVLLSVIPGARIGHLRQ